jgi:hypothetical protein
MSRGERAESKAAAVQQTLEEGVQRIDGLMERVTNCINMKTTGGARPSSVLPEGRLLLGDLNNAMDYEMLEASGVTHVVNTASSMPYALAGDGGGPRGLSAVELYAQLGIDCLSFDADDTPSYPILDKHFEEAATFISAALSKPDSKVLVHCFAGQNCSAAVCVAYKLVAEKAGLLATVADVFEKRRLSTSFDPAGSTAGPTCIHILQNSGFREQLVSFAATRGLLEACR